MSYYAIEWHDCHHTLVRTDTRGKRSKRNRRAIRAARRGDLDLAWRWVAGAALASQLAGPHSGLTR